MRVLTTVSIIFCGLAASSAQASAPAAWAALDKASAAACLKAAGTRGAKVGPATRYSDRLLIEARIVTAVGKEPRLCLYHRTNKRAEVQELRGPWPATPPMPISIKDARWIGEHVNGTPTVHNSLVTLMFGTDGKLTGKSGCNNYSANYSLSGKLLKVYPPMIGTRMTCPPEIMAQEDRFRAILEKASAIEIDGDGRLVIWSGDKQTLSFSRE